MKSFSFFVFLLLLFSSQNSFSNIIIQNLKWKKGQTLKILIMNGTAEHHHLFKRAVSIWKPYANLNFEFHLLNQDNTQLPQEYLNDTIRVQFNQNENSFSRLGRSFNLDSSKNITYLNIEHTPNNKVSFIGTAVHEFGHALGLLHEHQHPDSKQDEDIFGTCRYMFFLDISKESELKKCKNNLAVISSEDITINQLDLSPFDKYSVMLYESISKEPKGFFNASLSLGDKLFIAKHYPFENPLSAQQIEEMHQKDRDEELNWIIENYQTSTCKLEYRNDGVHMIQTRADKNFSVPIKDQKTIVHYFPFCSR